MAQLPASGMDAFAQVDSPAIAQTYVELRVNGDIYVAGIGVLSTKWLVKGAATAFEARIVMSFGVLDGSGTEADLAWVALGSVARKWGIARVALGTDTASGTLYIRRGSTTVASGPVTLVAEVDAP